MAETDPEMDRLREGDKEAFAEACKTLFPMDGRMTRKLLPDSPSGEEVAMGTLAEVPTPESLDNATPLEDFARAMAMCLAINGLFEEKPQEETV